MHLDSTRNQVNEEPICGCATCKSLFIYFIYFIFNCMGRKGKLLFRKIFKKKSGIGYEEDPRCSIMLVKNMKVI